MRKSSSHSLRRSEGPSDSDSITLHGLKIAQELLKRRPEAIQRLLCAVKRAEDIKGPLSSVVTEAKQRGIGVTFGDSTSAERGGVSLLLTPAAAVDLDKIIGCESELPLVIGLDGITDPQNLGSIFRLADAVGARGIFTSKDRSCPVSDVVRRVSSGATELVHISYVNNFASAIRRLKDQGYWIIGSALTESATDLYETKIPAPVCLLLGSEGDGLRRLSLELCDIVVKIPMNGTVRSLNVSQAGSIIAFEILRKIRNEG